MTCQYNDDCTGNPHKPWCSMGLALRKALERAATVLEELAESHPDCYGWEPLFPSTVSGISVEAAAARAALATNAPDSAKRETKL